MKRNLSMATVLGAAALLAGSAMAQPPAGSPGGPPPGFSGGPPSGFSGAPGSAPVAATSTTTTTTTAPLSAAPGGVQTDFSQSTQNDVSSDTSAANTLGDTGGEPQLFVIGGLVLMGAALLLRRRATA